MHHGQHPLELTKSLSSHILKSENNFVIQNGSGAHPASYPMGTGGSL
jgi:hypothetical protein